MEVLVYAFIIQVLISGLLDSLLWNCTMEDQNSHSIGESYLLS